LTRLIIFDSQLATFQLALAKSNNGLRLEDVSGDFFFRYLAPIFGLAAGLFRFLTAMVSKALAPALFEKGKKED